MNDATDKAVLGLMSAKAEQQEKLLDVSLLSLLTHPSIRESELDPESASAENKLVENPYHCEREAAEASIDQLARGGYLFFSPQTSAGEITAKGQERLSALRAAAEAPGTAPSVSASLESPALDRAASFRGA